MCGICGIVYADSMAPVDHDRLLAMRDTIAHRGPDDAGSYQAMSIDLGSRRLAILDLSAEGHMPMASPDGRFWIAYNGECYNFAELRPSLESKGYRFHSNSDTEVLLYLYQEEGPEMLDWLNGMFAIAIWDSHERTLFLARDRMGVKPVYYADRPEALYFASEEKALFAAGITPEFDSSTWEELLCFRYVAGERTPFTGIKRLLPGHYLTWRDGQTRITRWWNLADRARALRETSPRDPVAWFRRTFDDAVRLRRISDVPIGVLLSGGLDSSSVAASLGAQGATGVASFTVRFNEQYYDEGPLAKLVADTWGLDHHELIVPEDALASLLEKSSWLSDEPLAHGNDLYLYAIAAYAKPLVTVLLSGEGADELIGGYVRYRPLRYANALRQAAPLLSAVSALLPKASRGGSVASRVRKLSRFLSMDSPDDFVLFNSCDVLPADLERVGVRPVDGFEYRREVLAEAKTLYPREPMRQAMYLDQHTFLVSVLDRNDRMTMGPSIECRVPFLDYRLVQGLAAMPTPALIRGGRKALVREAFADRLPPPILAHRKWGFGVPWQKYFMNDPVFRAMIAEIPNSPSVVDGPFDRAKVRRLVTGYLGGDATGHALVRQLLFVTLWHRVCVAEVSPGLLATR